MNPSSSGVSRIDSHRGVQSDAPADRRDPLAADIARALELDTKFEDLSLGLVDGMVAAVAERRRVYRVLTSDRRDFGAIRVGPRLSRALELLP